MLEKVLKLVGIVKTAFAQGGQTDTDITIRNPLEGIGTFGQVADKIAQFLIIIGGPLVAIMILVGGYWMVTSGGNSERFTQGRKTILYAVIGFAVILLAQGVAAIIQNIFS